MFFIFFLIAGYNFKVNKDIVGVKQELLHYYYVIVLKESQVIWRATRAHRAQVVSYFICATNAVCAYAMIKNTSVTFRSSHSYNPNLTSGPPGPRQIGN